MAKTIIQIVNELTTKGHSVSLYHRKDGGYLVRSIDGMRYTGAMGNRIAREMAGEVLSTRRATQLESALHKRMSFSEEFGKDIYRRYKKLATKWRNAKLPKSAGKISMKKFRDLASSEGLEEALKALGEKEKYASGIAYSKNIQHLIDRLESYVEKQKIFMPSADATNQLNELIEKIRANANIIKEDDLAEILQVDLYDLEHAKTEEEMLDAIASITSKLGL